MRKRRSVDARTVRRRAAHWIVEQIAKAEVDNRAWSRGVRRGLNGEEAVIKLTRDLGLQVEDADRVLDDLSDSGCITGDGWDGYVVSGRCER